MKLLSAKEIKQWDEFTIQNKPISGLDLMERAAAACTREIHKHLAVRDRPCVVVCGPGNNGGDGLAIARMLRDLSVEVTVYRMLSNSPHSRDYQANYERLLARRNIGLVDVLQADDLELNEDVLIVDALFGTGLNRELSGIYAAVIQKINDSKAYTFSIDLPSGMTMNVHQPMNGPIVHADTTLTFGGMKLPFLFPETGPYAGKVEVLDIGLLEAFIEQTESNDFYLSRDYIQQRLPIRLKFSHKGHYGHAALVVGNASMPGAAVLAASACARSGVGLMTAYVPKGLKSIVAVSCPESLYVENETTSVAGIELSKDHHSALGIGCGLSQSREVEKWLVSVLRDRKEKVVLDADALNIISKQSDGLSRLKSNWVITPHPKEFDRLFGQHGTRADRWKTAQRMSDKLGIYIVLKGAHTIVVTPEGHSFFNSTGNAGMAKGGSGDVLTGLMAGLLAYCPTQDAVNLAVYLHGMAGDLAAAIHSETGMKAADIVDCIPAAWTNLYAG